MYSNYDQFKRWGKHAKLNKREKFFNDMKNRFTDSNIDETHFCRYCKQKEHHIEDCLKLKYVNTQLNEYRYNGKRHNSKSNEIDDDKTDEHFNFSDFSLSDRKYNWQANMMILVNQFSKIKWDYHDWYWNIVANVHLISFKSLLDNYIEFDRIDKNYNVQNIDEYSKTLDRDFITLTDLRKCKFTLTDVLYISTAWKEITAERESIESN